MALVCVPGEARTFEGHAFIVEAAVSLGGKDTKVSSRKGPKGNMIEELAGMLH